MQTRNAGARLRRVLTLFLLAIGFNAAPAAADTATLQFLDAAGTNDPVVDVGRTAVLSGNSSTEKALYVRVRPAGGAPCAPSASTDSGDAYHWYGGTDVNGDFRETYSDVWTDPGTFVFCIWIADSGSQRVTPIAQTITFRNPTGTISGTVAPVTPVAGDTVTLSVTGSSESPKAVYAKVRPDGGAPCATSHSVDSGSSLLYGREVNGAFGLTDTFTAGAPGSYLVCLWLASSDDDATPIAGPQPFTFTVLKPCVVPSVSPGASVKKATKKLVKAGCTAGATKTKRSRSVRAGRFLRYKPGPKDGVRLPPGTAIGLVVARR